MSRPPRHDPLRGLALSAAVVLLAGCGGPPPPDAGLPQGLLLSGDRDALDRALARFDRLPGTPAAVLAARARERMAGCTHVDAAVVTSDVPALVDALACRAPGISEQPLDRVRGDADFALALPIDGLGRAVAVGRVDPMGGVSVEVRLRPVEEPGTWRFLLPGDGPPPPPSLDPSRALAHGRFRGMGGMDLAGLVPEGGHLDVLLNLRSRIFSGAVLDGAWEFAVYPPSEDQGMVLAVLGAGFRVRTAAEAAMAAFVGELEARWGVTRAPFAVGEAAGACLPDVRLLPAFSPCYVVTRSSVVVGWNEAAVALALGAASGPAAPAVPAAPAPPPESPLAPAPVGPPPAPGAPAPPGASPAGVAVFLDRFPAADAAIRRVLAPEAAAPAPAYPWRRVSFTTWQEGADVRADLSLLPDGTTP